MKNVNYEDKNGLLGFDSSRCYIESASLDYDEYLGIFIEEYLNSKKEIEVTDKLIDDLFSLALDKFYYISVSDQEIRDFVDDELNKIKSNIE